MTPPNLFDFATKELSQDAVICWLIAWAGAGTEGRPADGELRRCGVALLNALFAKWHNWPVELGEVVRTEVVRQEHNIDMLARVDGRHVLLIEDKTDTGAHDGQLGRYLSLVVEGRTRFGKVANDDLFPIYFKTGNHSLKDRRDAEAADYRVFDRTDFLGVLETYRGTNAILVDFRRHLTRWEEDTAGFRGWTRHGQKTARGWEGLFRCIEECSLKDSEDDWGPLSTRVGGYWGIWIEPERSTNSRFAMWIEEEKISFRLFGSVAGMNCEKDYWAGAFVEAGPGRFERPRRLAATSSKPMSVAEWRDWLAFGDDDRLDIAGTLENLRAARKMLLDTIGGA